MSDPSVPSEPSDPVPVPSEPVPVPGATEGAMPVLVPGQRRLGKLRSPWGVWWLSYLTLGIYYLVWYAKVNRELMQFAPEAVRVKPGLAVLAQLCPVTNWVSLAHTARRINAAHAAAGTTSSATGAMAVISSFWYASQTRYLQRRINHLWDPTNSMSK